MSTVQPINFLSYSRAPFGVWAITTPPEMDVAFPLKDQNLLLFIFCFSFFSFFFFLFAPPRADVSNDNYVPALRN